MYTSRHCEGFSKREAHPQELNAPGKGVFGKSNRMTWRFEWIARSKKFSKKSSYAISSWIGFLEGIAFLGAMMRRLKEREREREKNRNRTKTLRQRKEGKMNIQCMNMWRAKRNCIMGKNTIQPNRTHKI